MFELVEFLEDIKNKFIEYIETVSSKYNIESHILMEILEQSKKDCMQGDIFTKEKSKTDNPDPTGKCIAIIKSGQRKGNSCDMKISVKSTTKNYCARHLKLETAEQIEKRETAVSKAGDIVFRLNKFGNFQFGSTGLVIKNEKCRVVIGKQDGTSVVDLTEEDINTCKTWKLKYIKNYSETQEVHN